MAPLRSRAFASALAAALGASGCSQTFDPSNEVESVRVLAVRADPPYAAPGATVSLDVLAVDGRASKPAPMNVAWLPGACIDPPGDAYYACFPAFGAQFPPGVDLTGTLVSGSNDAIALPADVITAHPATGSDPYGLAVVFAVACAGHVEYRPPPAGSSPATVPFGCFDANENALGADDFVFAYALVYAFADRTNANPVIDHLTIDGMEVDPDAGASLARCAASEATKCPTTPVDTVVPASSQEDEGAVDANGRPLKEEIWVDYYVTGTQLASDTSVLYDPIAGALEHTPDDLYAPRTSGDQQLWAVVHDDRGGVAWTAMPLHVP